MEARYLSMEYGPVSNKMCNIHASKGTQHAKTLHYHDFYQIYFIIKGKLIHHTEKKSVSLGAGDCFIIPPRFNHRISNGSESTVFYSFSFQSDFLGESISENPTVKGFFDMLTPENTMLKFTLKEDRIQGVRSLFDYALIEFEEQLAGWECTLRGLLSALLVIFARTYSAGEISTVRSDYGIQDCIAYVNAHFCEPICVDELLSRFHFSHSTFSRMFLKTTGQSFQSYLAELRVNRARVMLRESSKSMLTIALECGWGDYSSFYRAFCSKMGISPRKYRLSIN
ncbi:MAG: helix-turn-helix domain-containing protein [Ruminococcaceae bacterium]|nr:helix-turn-helix domain-containing protein [Oscillospiraceae bacterium]